MNGVTDCLLYLTSPTYIPGIVSGILYGIGAIALLDKSKRHKFFLSYFYLGSGALLYAVSEVFDLVWDRAQEERSAFPLHASLLLTTFGAIFFLLALFRLVETWQQVGMRQGRRVLSLLAPMIIIIAGILSTVGNALMVQQDKLEEKEEKEENLLLSGKTRVAILLQATGAVINLVLLVVYFILLCVLARKRRSGQTSLVAVLGVLGLLIMVRWVYYAYLLSKMLIGLSQTTTTEDNVAMDIPGREAYMACIVLPEVLVIVLAIFYDLTQVKNGVEELRPQGFVSFEKQNEAHT